MLSDAIARAKAVYSEAKKREHNRRKSRPITARGFVQYWQEKSEYILPTKKDTFNKVAGLVKLLKNNHYDDRDIYDLIDKVFEAWPRLTTTKMYTLNKKEYILDDKPNLLDFVNCRDRILAELEVQPENEGKSLLEIWRGDD